ncbi:MAG: aminotransferase class I/II-fold pyridoxal phosphate-dependent enzyme [Byssovorax sp.]
MAFLIPSHASRPGDDLIFALNAEARARAQAGESIINGTLGAMMDDAGRLAVLPSVDRTLREIPAEVTAAYAPISGSTAFLRAVVTDLLGDREEATQAVAVATPGGSGALRLALGNLLEPGQTLLTTSLYWGPYKTLADEAERKLTTFRMFDEQGRLDVVDFEAKLAAQVESEGRALVFLNSPCHNPTGYSFDDAEWDAVAAVVERVADRGPVSILLDVAYARYGATDLSHAVDRVIHLAKKALILFAWSASKSFTEYGLRVGALVAVVPDPAARREMENAFSYSCRGTWSNCNAGGMAAIAKILGNPALKAQVDAERAELKAVLDRRVAVWNEHAGKAGLRYPRYTGGFFTTVFCDDAAGAAAKLRGEGLFVVPQPGALRVALCSVAERDIPRLVEGIARHTR